MEKIIDKISFPSEWTQVRLKEIGTVFKGKGVSKSEIIETGIPCIRYGEIYTNYDFVFSRTKSFISEDSAKQSQLIKKGDVLFAGSGETPEDIGKAVAYNSDAEAYAGGDIVIFRPDNDDDGNFLGYLLNSEYVNQQKFQVAQGHSVVHLYGKNIEELKVVLPSSIERKRIAEILSEWDALIEQQSKLIKAKEQQKKGLINQLFNNDLRFQGFDEDWEEAPLADVCTVFGEYGINAPGVEYSRDLPKYLRITDITSDGELDEKNMVSVNHPDSQKFLLNDKDLVFARTGASVGKSYIHDIKRFGTLVFAGFLIRFRTNPERLNPHFLKAFTETEYYWNWVTITSVRSGQPGINGKEYSEMVIPLPQIEEQNKIACVYLEMTKEIQAMKLEFELFQKQKRGLMQQLLTGKIRVSDC